MPKVRLLLIVTLLFVVLMGALAALSHGSLTGNFGQDFLRSLMYSIGKGGALNTDDTGVSFVYFLVMLLSIFYCMFFSAILIGLISNALRSKVEELGKGHSRVLESGHTLILGFNDAAFVLIGELLEANRNRKNPGAIVILGSEADQTVMMDKIRKKFAKSDEYGKTRIICRNGSIYDFDDLRMCSIETSRVVVINAENDFDSVKAVMACTHILDERGSEGGPFIVSILQSRENLVESRAAAAENEQVRDLVTMPLNVVLARIMVHTSRQAGLSDVFTELFNFKGNEFYIFDKDPVFAKLYGKKIVEINDLLKMSFAVGARKKNGKVMVGDPRRIIFEEGDSLIVVKADDNPLVLRSAAHETRNVEPGSVVRDDQIRVLIIGVDPMIDPVLEEYANYLERGSQIFIADRESRFDDVVTERTKALLDEKGIGYTVMPVDAGRKSVITGILRECEPDSVLQLIAKDSPDPAAEDERAMRTLVFMREYRTVTGKQFSITSEMLKPENKALAQATGVDDFIINKQFAALLTAQISENKEMAALFETLLSSEGYEIYMKPASWYVPIGEPVDMIDVSHSAAARGEIYIGHRSRLDEKHMISHINPAKYESDMKTLKKYRFGEEDYFVVLSDDGQYHTAG